MGSEIITTRPKNSDAVPKRLIEVVVIDYQHRRHLRVVIDGTRIVEARDLEGQPAFHTEEIVEAKAIAEADLALHKLGTQRNVFVSPFAPGASERGQRRVGLRFVLRQKDDSGSILATAEVDLVEQKLLAVELFTKPSSPPVQKGNIRGRFR